MAEEFEAVVTKVLPKSFLVILLNDSLGVLKEKSLIFFKDAWIEDLFPVVGQSVLLSNIIVAGKNIRNSDQYRALSARSKPINVNVKD